jgi:hypothetical protein
MNYQINTNKGTIDLSSATGMVAESNIETVNIRTLNFWLKDDEGNETNFKINGNADLRIGQRISFLWSKNGTKILFNHNTDQWYYNSSGYEGLHSEKLLNKKIIRFTSYILVIMALSLGVFAVGSFQPLFFLFAPILASLIPILGAMLAKKRLKNEAEDLYENQIRGEVNRITNELIKL